MPVKSKSIVASYNKRTAGIASRERDPFYHTSLWRRLSKMFISEHQLCESCYEKGILTEAKVTDHIIPKNKCNDPYDESNWRALCFKCHAEKSATDRKHFSR